MQNIQVKRYKKPNGVWDGWIEPEDGSWILFIPIEGAPQLFRRTQMKSESGHEESLYVSDKEIDESLL